MTQNTNPRDTALATMSAWVAAIADNVSNPVAGVSAALGIIEAEMATFKATGSFRPELVDDSLRRVRDRLHKLGDYVAELVEVGRVPAIAPERLVLADTCRLLQESLDPHHRPAVEIVINPGAEEVIADPIRLKAVLKALVMNALEAVHGLGKPAPQVRITAAPQRPARAGTSAVALTVEDNGPGFDPEGLSRGVEPFYSSKEAGTGLGLTVAKRFADAHGGLLVLGSSVTLGGAAVTIVLPGESSGKNLRLAARRPS